jgi:hypothetical protein
MSPSAVIGLIVVVILAIVFQIMLTDAEEAAKNRTPTPISHLRSIIELSEHGMWLVTITRRSGYDHAAWNVPGSRDNALDLALEKLRHARIDVVEVICNRPEKFEVNTFYDSNGARRTGKYIGGFTIIPQKQ